MLLLVTLCGCALWVVSARFSRRGLRLRYLWDWFWLVWLYYALSVPFDLLTGLEVPVIALSTLPDLDSPASLAFVIQATVFYILFGVGFWAGYSLVPGRREDLTTTRRRPPEIPHGLLFGISLVVGVLYAVFLWQESRQARILSMESSLSLKLVALSLTVTVGILSYHIATTDDRRRALALLLVGAILAGLTGGRTFMLFLPLVYVTAHWRWLSWRVLATATPLVLTAFLFWKPAYVALTRVTLGEEVAALEDLFDPTGRISLSALDAMHPMEIVVKLLQDNEERYALGGTYLLRTVQVAGPRAFQRNPTPTLAEQYTREWHPIKAERGGGLAFSAIGEAWLNFGAIGPGLVGLLFGVLVSIVERRGHLIAKLVMMVIIFRLFRSDAASLFKSWVVFFGGGIALSVYLTELAQNQLRQRSRLGIIPSRGE